VHSHNKEIEAMLRRCWSLALVGIFTFALAPVWGQANYNKDEVKALSKRIDEHLARVWKKANVTPAPKADDYVFFRRLHLDLAGRIPEFLQVFDFVDPTNDSPDKRWEAVDRLLDNPEHARHFANVWRNIMIGNQPNPQFQFLIPQFEMWVREKVEKNVSIDKMVNQLLTSQQGNPNQGINFPGGGGQLQGSPQLFFVSNENKAENLAGATSRVFLGVKIECAQCHAHPFAKWSKDQFWEFAAFYSQNQQQPRPKGAPAQPMPGFQPGREILIPGTDKVVKAKFLNGAEPKWDILNNSRKTLADWVSSAENPYFAKAMADHIWSYLMGVSLLEPIMEPSDDAPITHPELLNDMAKALIENGFDAKFLIRAIVHTDAYQRSSGGTKLADKEDYNLFVRMPIRALSPEQIYDSFWMATSNGEKQQELPFNQQQFINPGQMQSPRAQFLLKFTNQDRRHEPQTSILQALFMMNGNVMSDRTKLANNQLLKDLANQPTGHEKRISSLYRIVLSREPRSSELDRLTRYLNEASERDRNATQAGEANRHEHLGQALSDVYWALLNSSEFLLNH